MALNVLDRAIAAVLPERGAKRARARLQMDAVAGMNAALGGLQASTGGGYDTAAPTPWNRRWAVYPRDAATDTLRGLPALRAQSSDLVRNHPIAASAINTKVVRAIGTGLALSAQPHRATLGWTEEQAAEWRAQVHAEFSLWADSDECTFRRSGNFYDHQDLALRAMLERGDSFTVLPDGVRSRTMPYALRLQLLESDRIGNPGNQQDTDDIVAGIRFADGAPTACHVYDRHPGAAMLGRVDLWGGVWIDFVGASGRRKVLHHFKALRPEQPRGIPDLAPVMQLFKDLGTYTDAEIKAAVVSAFLTVFIESDAGAGAAPVFGLGDPAQGGGVGGGPAGDEIAMGPAAVIGLARGEKANVSNPGRPNPAFGPFVSTVIDQLGAGLFIGPEMLMKRYNTSYVAARAAFLDAWKHLLDLRTRIARTLCQPVYETWLTEAVAIGRIAAPGFFADPLIRWAYTRAQWPGDSQGSINPKDEVAAYLAAVDGRLMSREAAEWQLFGTDWGETYDVKKAEQTRLKADDMLPVPKAGAPAAQPPEAPAASTDGEASCE